MPNGKKSTNLVVDNFSDDGAYQDPDKENFHYSPALKGKSKPKSKQQQKCCQLTDDDDDDLYQDPEGIDFKKPPLLSNKCVSSNNSRRMNSSDYDSPDEDVYEEPPLEARTPPLHRHQQTRGKCV